MAGSDRGQYASLDEFAEAPRKRFLAVRCMLECRNDYIGKKRRGTACGNSKEYIEVENGVNRGLPAQGEFPRKVYGTFTAASQRRFCVSPIFRQQVSRRNFEYLVVVNGCVPWMRAETCKKRTILGYSRSVEEESLETFDALGGRLLCSDEALERFAILRVHTK